MPVMPQGNLVEVLGHEVRQGSPGQLKVESSPSRQRRPPCKTNKEMSDEAADAASLTYVLTYLLRSNVMNQHAAIPCDLQGPSAMDLHLLALNTHTKGPSCHVCPWPANILWALHHAEDNVSSNCMPQIGHDTPVWAHIGDIGSRSPGDQSKGGV